jgi:lipopolysaccharide export system protein LptA
MIIRVSVKITILFVLLSGTAFSQEKIRQADIDGDSLYAVRTANGEFTYIIGNVIIQQKETTIYSDSAIWNRKENQIEFFKNVRITEGDSIVITADRLMYEGDQKIARLRDNVVFRKLDRATLFTDNLDYFRQRQEARYFDGGRLVDSTNVLTSDKGYYQMNTNMASFKKNVVLVNPDYTLESDTLQYHARTNIVYFRAPTEITDPDGTVVNLSEGEYNTRIRRSDLRLGEIETISYRITGTRMTSDDITKKYRARGNVVITGKENEIIITGEDANYNKQTGEIFIFGNPVMKKILDNDTLYMSADTLKAIENIDPAKDRLLAYHDVKIFKTDLQGIADSMAYFSQDSTLYFYQNPVLWSGVNQMTADSIHMLIKDNTIDQMIMRVNSFVVSEDSLNNYNQIKGRDMNAYFRQQKMHHVDVEGNSESVFFALDETNTYLVGMNKSISSNMRINFKDNRADNISFYVEPDADFIPPHELQDSQKKLPGFNWRGKERPTKAEVLHEETEKIETTPMSNEKVQNE